MNKNIIFVLVFIIVICWGEALLRTNNAFSQDVHYWTSDSKNWTGAFSPIGVGAKALAMGGAYIALADDATAFYWNPAGAGMVVKRHATAMYTDLYGLGMITHSYIGLAQPDRGGGASSFGWIMLRAKLEEEGGNTPKWNENIVGYSYAKRVSRTLSVGGTFKGLIAGTTFEKSTGGTIGARGISTDLGFIFAPSVGFRIGAVGKNLYSTIKWTTEETNPYHRDKEKLPVLGSIGLMVQPATPFTILVDANGGEEYILKSVSAGVEYKISKGLLAMRGGFTKKFDATNILLPSFGIGLNYGRSDYTFHFDYVFSLDSTNALGKSTPLRISISGEF
jgi:hypothetical protein